ncbi:protealysin inhibitor emfourin [Subtercola frigoramans]|uniref:Uncharacterized protein n=1 Tax=Subtercola frigoramans TaxID=120298 RepID=A0ABS2L525_9MICO|nr:protealysin inhibitor emfourin [Subtercola frigoramans]MBM7471556.1 hypothetical protein [Subtercola frigoramans]
MVHTPETPETRAQPPEAPKLRVSIVRSGGFAGLNRTWTAEATSEADISAWSALLDQCSWRGADTPGAGASVGPNAGPSASPVPDRFSYRISVSVSTNNTASTNDTVSTNNTVSTTNTVQPERSAVLAESELNGPWRQLLDRVQSAE